MRDGPELMAFSMPDGPVGRGRDSAFHISTQIVYSLNGG